MILRHRVYATYWISVDRNRKRSDTENIRQCSWSHKILTLILLSGVLIFFINFLDVSSVVLSLPFYYYICILDVTIRLPSMLVWAWYVLRTDCTTVLSPVYWHNFSKQAVREAAQYAPAPVRRTLQPRSTHTQVFHPWWCENCRVIQQQFWMKEFDILWGQNILWPLLHIFRGSRPPTPPDLRPRPRG